MDANLNIAECIKSVQQWTGTNYVNICNGSTQFVSYGPLDFLMGAFLLAMIGVLITVIITVGWQIVRF